MSEDIAGGLERAGLYVERNALLARYQTPGHFSARDMGIPERAGVVMPRADWLRNIHQGTIFPGRIIYDPAEHISYWEREQNYFRYQQMFERVPMDTYRFAVEEDHRGPLRSFIHYRMIDSWSNPLLSAEPGRVPDYLEDFAWDATELSFMANGFADGVLYGRTNYAYILAEATIGTPLWKLPSDELEKQVSQVMQKHQVRNLTSMVEVDERDEIIGYRIIRQAEVLRALVEGDETYAQEMMHRDPVALLIAGNYLFSMLRMGVEGKGIIDSIFTDEEVRRALITLARSERDIIDVPAIPDEHQHGVSAFLSNNFSAFTNAALDMGVARFSPLAFAFGNLHTLQALNMGERTYVERMRATGVNVDYPGDHLATVREVFENQGGDRSVITVAKSVYTALGEAMFELEGGARDMPRLRELLTHYNIAFPDVSQASQYERDFVHIQALNELLTLWQNGGHKDIDQYIANLAEEVRRTADIVRGSIYAPAKDIEAIVAEAMTHDDIRLQLVLSYFDKKNGSQAKIVLFRNHPEELVGVRDSLTEQLEEMLGNNWQEAALTDIMEAFYQKHEGQYPYASIHMYGEVHLVPGLYMQSDPQTTHIGERQLYLAGRRREARQARAVFKGPQSSHVKSAERQFLE